MGYNSQAENRAKTALRRGSASTLNLYTIDGGQLKFAKVIQAKGG